MFSDAAGIFVNMVEMLPEEDQVFAQEFVKKLVLVWDPILPESRRRKQKKSKRQKKADLWMLRKLIGIT